jgi:hypothetical protein
MSEIKTIERFGEFQFTVVLKSGAQIYTGWKEMFEGAGRQSIRKIMTASQGSVFLCDDAEIDADEIAAITEIVFEEAKENEND